MWRSASTVAITGSFSSKAALGSKLRKSQEMPGGIFHSDLACAVDAENELFFSTLA